jgi:hypothetical protein
VRIHGTLLSRLGRKRPIARNSGTRRIVPSAIGLISAATSGPLRIDPSQMIVAPTYTPSPSSPSFTGATSIITTIWGATSTV